MTGTSSGDEGTGANGTSSMSAWTGTSSGAGGAGAGGNGAGLCDIVTAGCGGSACFTKTGMLLPVTES